MSPTILERSQYTLKVPGLKKGTCSLSGAEKGGAEKGRERGRSSFSGEKGDAALFRPEGEHHWEHLGKGTS